MRLRVVPARNFSKLPISESVPFSVKHALSHKVGTMRTRAELYLRLVIVGLMATGCLQLCGCHQTVMVFGPSTLPNALAPSDITDDDKKATAAKRQLPGIPFYNHYGVCTHETVWLEPQTTLILTVTADDGNPVTQKITLNMRPFTIRIHKATMRTVL